MRYSFDEICKNLGKKDCTFVKWIDNYETYTSKFIAECSRGHEFITCHAYIIRNSGCPICKESRGERRIRKWLNDKRYIFESQKEFDGLIGTGGGLLSYDFYLPEQNILIEYQGVFHDGSNGEYTQLNLEKQKEHDKRKREFAERSNIELLEIWYWDFENIEEILINKLYINSINQELYRE